MSIIKERIRLTGTGATITFGLSGKNRISGYQQEIDNLTEETKDALVNPIVDNEVRRFNYAGSGPTFIQFSFTNDGSNHYNTFFPNAAGFTVDEINSYDDNLRNSFFILDFYDSFDSYTQSKIFTSYLTKVLDGEDYLTMPIPTYKMDSNTVSQFYNWNVPKTYIDAHTGYTVTAYTKFSFYNAKYGFVSLFYRCYRKISRISGIQ
jgi:hypothetical protein